MKDYPALALAGVFLSSLLLAQQPKPNAGPAPQMPPPPLVTPEVHPDNTVTFRFRAPNAQEVRLVREGTQPVSMQKDDQGVWAVTTPPLDPDYYGYSIVVDGQRMLDPYHHLLVPNFLTPANASVGSNRCAARRGTSSLLQIGSSG